MELTHLKAQLLAKRFQLIKVDEEGTILQSENILLELTPGTKLETLDPFFEGMTEMLLEENNFPLEYPSITLAQQNLIVDILIYRLKDHYIFILEDRSKWYKEFQLIQQERNQKSLENSDLYSQNKNLALERELLRIKNSEMLRMQEFKSAFFSKVSHELRTPISGIIGLSSLLENARENSKDSEKFIKSLKSSAGHLQSIVNDVLDMSKIESGKFKLNNQPVNLGELIEDVVLSFYYQAQEKGLDLKSFVPNTLPTWVEADVTRIRQILFNLLNNAMKFTSEGHLAIHVSYEAKGADVYRIVFKIEDTGIGIAKEHLDKIFGEYEQATHATQSTYGGTGLGLSVVKQLVQLYDGNISVSSIEGEGSIFSFDLLLKAAKNPNIAQVHALELHNQTLRVLIADDEPINLMILKRHFEGQCALCTVVNNGAEVLEKMAENTYDLLITDVNMPGKTGIDLAYALKDSGLVIFLLSGEFLNEQHPVFVDKVVERSFLKPVNPRELFNAINLIF
jgi:signal transduction histidine kinase